MEGLNHKILLEVITAGGLQRSKATVQDSISVQGTYFTMIVMKLSRTFNTSTSC